MTTKFRHLAAPVLGSVAVTILAVCVCIVATKPVHRDRALSPVNISSSARPASSHTMRTVVRGKLPAYNSAIRSGMFSAPQPPAPAAAPPPLPQGIVAPPEAPDPLADLEFAGSVTIEGKTFALIQSRSTGEGEYVAEGGQWRGMTVTSVSPQQIAIDPGQGPRTVAMSDENNVVQLSSSAPGVGQGQPSAERVALLSAPADLGTHAEAVLQFTGALSNDVEVLSLKSVELGKAHVDDTRVEAESALSSISDL